MAWQSFAWVMPGVPWYLYLGHMVTPKIDAQANAPVLNPPCCKLAISRMKRGGVEEVVASHIF